MQQDDSGYLEGVVMASRFKTAERFILLADEWEKACAGISMIRRMFQHPAYLRIVENSKEFLPYVLSRLANSEGMWFGVLEEAVGTRPFTDDEAGDYDKMRDAWLRWGREKGLLV